MSNRLESFYKAFGGRLRAFRDASGLTQAALGQLLDPPVTRASIANLEAGKQRVLAHSVVDLARVLRVTVGELLGEQGTASPAASRQSLEDELAAKLGLAPDKRRALAERLAQASAGREEEA